MKVLAQCLAEISGQPARCAGHVSGNVDFSQSGQRVFLWYLSHMLSYLSSNNTDRIEVSRGVFLVTILGGGGFLGICQLLLLIHMATACGLPGFPGWIGSKEHGVDFKEFLKIHK